jgi:2-polyprenyl-6-methoxyphenol hydroxylase-like FAD-dependent oxidoreductase
MERVDETFALIVGGGPVGLTLALDLGRRGVPAMLVSKNKLTSQTPKANYLTIRAMEYYRKLGIADDITKANPGFVPTARLSFRTSYCGYEICCTDAAFRHGGKPPSAETYQRLSQMLLEPILKSHVERLPSVDVRFGSKASDFSINENGGQATLTHGDTREQTRVNFRFLIGCDGAESAIRGLIGAQMVGRDGGFQRRFISRRRIIYLVRASNLDALSPHQPTEAVWVITDRGCALVLRHDANGGFVIQYQMPEQLDPNGIDANSTVSALLGPGVEFEILSEELWDGGVAKVADRYQRDSAFLAGDAAHILNPLAGLPMGTGIDDAINLGWKLSAIHQGWANPGLLNSYTEERQEAGVRNSVIGLDSANRMDNYAIPQGIDAASPDGEQKRQELGWFIKLAESQEANFFNAQLGCQYTSSIIVDPADIPENHLANRYHVGAEAGCRLPHFSVSGGRSIYQMVGNDFSLLVCGDMDVAAIEQAAADRSLPLAVIRVTSEEASHLRSLMLVRPDLYIAWSSDELPLNPGEILDQARGEYSW